MSKINVIDYFSGEYAFLSNFYPCKAFDGKSVEHHYQAAKSDDPSDKAAIVGTFSPGHAKKLGKNLWLTRLDWDDVKFGIMQDLIRRKFSDPELAQKLVATGDAELVEGNAWHDNYWGRCFCAKCSQGPASNHLGRILMDLRQELRAK